MIEDLLKAESERLTKEVADLMREGFEPFQFYSDPPTDGDQIRRFGFMVLIKRKKKPDAV